MTDCRCPHSKHSTIRCDRGIFVGRGDKQAIDVPFNKAMVICVKFNGRRSVIIVEMVWEFENRFDLLKTGEKGYCIRELKKLGDFNY